MSNRNLTMVLDSIITICMDNEFKASLTDIRSSVVNAAPEMMSFWWEETYDIISKYYPIYKKEVWYQSTLSIFSFKKFEDVVNAINSEENK